MRRVYGVFMTIAIIIIIMGCDSATIRQSEINAFISNHRIGDKFVVKDLPWLSSKQSVLENLTQEVIDESPSFIKTAGDVKLPEAIEQTVTYKFQDDEFLLVTYVFRLNDEYMPALMAAFGQAVSDLIYGGQHYPPAFEKVPESVNSSYMFSYDSQEDLSNIRMIVEKISGDDYTIYMDVVSPKASPANTIKPLSP